MGVHKRQREIEDLKEHYIKKSSCYLLVFMALLVGAFIGNTITMLYVGNNPSPAQQFGSAPVQQQQNSHVADPNALAALEKAATNNPTNAEAWIELGHFCFDHNLPGKAATAYERALELKPMNVSVWSDLGVMYRRSNRFKDALNAFQQAANLDPKHIVSRFNMGVVYLHDLNDKEKALKAWKEVLVIDPNAKAPTGKPVADLIEGIKK